MDYLVRDPVIVNGVRRRRGDVLTGADAAAVDASPTLKARCIEHIYNERLKAAAAKAAPAAKSAKGE